MLFSIRNNRKHYHTIIIDAIEDNLYRKERYGFDFAIAIAICDTDICMRDFANKIRKTDKFIVLENHLCSVMLEGISNETAIKATSNLQTSFQNRYFGKELFIGLVSSTDYTHNEGDKMVNSLLDLLDYSISKNMSHEVVDHYHLEYL